MFDVFNDITILVSSKRWLHIYTTGLCKSFMVSLNFIFYENVVAVRTMADRVDVFFSHVSNYFFVISSSPAVRPARRGLSGRR